MRCSRAACGGWSGYGGRLSSSLALGTARAAVRCAGTSKCAWQLQPLALLRGMAGAAGEARGETALLLAERGEGVSVNAEDWSGSRALRCEERAPQPQLRPRGLLREVLRKAGLGPRAWHASATSGRSQPGRGGAHSTA